jgi:uncharacterized membrane protein (UPF0127 family)
MPTFGAVADGFILAHSEREDEPLCRLLIAQTASSRARGLLGRRQFDDALLLRPCRSVHTLGMSMVIDVAYLDQNDVVLAIRTMRPGRIGRPRIRARAVVETAAGRFAGWGVRPGDVLHALPQHL